MLMSNDLEDDDYDLNPINNVAGKFGLSICGYQPSAKNSLISGASVYLQQDEDGEWIMTQTYYDSWQFSHDNVVGFNWSFGPISNQGEIDPDSLDIKLNPSYCGIAAGAIEGNLKDGLMIKVNLESTMGSQRWYLKNGNEVWTHYDIKVKFNGAYEGDKKIIVL
ncbi:hypothetical protein FBEOM_8689 [Fusarium beomiforme]|uniref:Uncharacterized protein n=1 Tax=Fusarium beomiforme TaxID=44412 RepID=A0A9P5AEX6_9HYPO|nr:hypothetical protein FBEOM_8689 [Fusarium beomiforme]